MNPSGNRRVTMRMLADQLGVTATTVSLALRNHSSISEKTRERVKKLAKEMNYRPDPAIAAIAAQRWSGGSPRRHRVVAFIRHHYPPGVVHQASYLPAARQRATELGYKLEEFYIDDYPTGKAFSRMLYSRGIRGLLIPSIHNPESKRVANLDWDKFTSVCCGVGRVSLPLHTVTKDTFQSTKMVWETLFELGYRKIGAAINCHKPVALDDWGRIGATMAAIKILGMNKSAKIPLLTSEVEDEASLVAWYRKYKPKVIVGFNFSTGEMLEANGVRIPEDVEIVCLISKKGSKWTGICEDPDKTGTIAMELLNDQLCENQWGIPDRPNLVLLENEWNIGSSLLKSEAIPEFCPTGSYFNVSG